MGVVGVVAETEHKEKAEPKQEAKANQRRKSSIESNAKSKRQKPKRGQERKSECVEQPRESLGVQVESQRVVN